MSVPAKQSETSQDRLNAHTQARYQALSYFEKQELIRWLKKHLKTLPFLSKTKESGLAALVAGEDESVSALLLIRHAMKELGF